MLTDTTGLITDRYNYDAFGVLLSPNSGSSNPYQFAGERRDSGTGLDYLRARYYDSSLGRFVSKDAFTGFLNDPMSQHDYQYAHANPVVNTDPTGYFTLGDVLNTITTASQLALIGSTSFAGGYMTVGILSGANAGDVLQMFSDFAGGFASGISGGYLTNVYESYSGHPVEPRHGVLWGAGNIAGISSSFLIGMKLPSYMATTVSPTLRWMAVGATGLSTGFDVYGAAQATQNLYQSYQDNGRWEWQDAWNLLNYVPFVGMFGSLKRGFGATRDVPNPVGSVNEEIKLGTGDYVVTKAEGNTNCFVAGTEILTSEGEKDIEDIVVGDWVIADDPTTPGEIEAKQVLETFVRSTDGLVDLYVDGEVISTTGEHPFWVADKGWVEAKDLLVGSLLQTEDGRIIDVDRIEKRSGQFEVYNFKVEGFHTYFVSDLGILVHNAEYGRFLRRQIGDPPTDMENPHAHHILQKLGREGTQRALVQEGQAILRKHGIDPIWGLENLVWAPNRGHTTAAQELVVEELKAVDAAGLGYDDIVTVLRRHGRIAANR
nr:polymorphic toxin-type HINT domain-containing protein [Argonema antarcticum]